MHYRAHIQMARQALLSVDGMCVICHVVLGDGSGNGNAKRQAIQHNADRFLFRCNASSFSWSSCGKMKEIEGRQNQGFSAQRLADPRTKTSLASSSSCSSSCRVSSSCQPRPRRRPLHRRNRAFDFQCRCSVKLGGRSQWRDAISGCATEPSGCDFRHRRACLSRMPLRNSIRAA